MIAAFTLNVCIDRRYTVHGAKAGAVNRVAECAASPGGKGLNVARILRALDVDAVAGGIAGGDAGRFILRKLGEEGIAHDFTLAAGESRSCINVYDPATGETTEYLEPGMVVSPEEYADFLACFDRLCAGSEIITLSGSLPRGVSATAYADLIHRAREMGRPVLLDASGTALKEALAAQPCYIKPNEDEIAALTGCDARDEKQVRDAAVALHRQGIARVAVSLGKRGALLACEEGVLRAEPPAVRAVNPVGCGDAMTAAFAVAQLNEWDAAESLRFAVAVSAASAMSVGTGEMEQKNYQEILPLVKIWKA